MYYFPHWIFCPQHYYSPPGCKNTSALVIADPASALSGVLLTFGPESPMGSSPCPAFPLVALKAISSSVLKGLLTWVPRSKHLSFVQVWEPKCWFYSCSRIWGQFKRAELKTTSEKKCICTKFTTLARLRQLTLNKLLNKCKILV